MKQQTQRTYTNIETGIQYAMFNDPSTGINTLEKDNEIIRSFWTAAFTNTEIKLSTGKVIDLDAGQFYHIKKGQTVTHYKYTMLNKRFKKV